MERGKNSSTEAKAGDCEEHENNVQTMCAELELGSDEVQQQKEMVEALFEQTEALVSHSGKPLVNVEQEGAFGCSLYNRKAERIAVSNQSAQTSSLRKEVEQVGGKLENKSEELSSLNTKHEKVKAALVEEKWKFDSLFNQQQKLHGSIPLKETQQQRIEGGKQEENAVLRGQANDRQHISEKHAFLIDILRNERNRLKDILSKQKEFGKSLLKKTKTSPISRL